MHQRTSLSSTVSRISWIHVPYAFDSISNMGVDSTKLDYIYFSGANCDRSTLLAPKLSITSTTRYKNWTLEIDKLRRRASNETSSASLRTIVTLEPKELKLSTCVCESNPDMAATTPVSSNPYKRPHNLIARQRSGATTTASCGKDSKDRCGTQVSQ